MREKNQANNRLWPVLVLIISFMIVLLPVQAQQGSIAAGDIVQVVTNGQRLNLRRLPGLDQEIVARLENGATMTVTGGPQEASGYVWWEIEGGGNRGWAAEPFLKVVEAVSTPLPAVTATRSVAPSPVPGGQENQEDHSAEEPGAIRMADAYGFEGVCFLGWKKPTLDDFMPVEFDTAYTYTHAKNANKWLLQAGFQSTVHKNATALDAIQQITDNQVFFFYGHGQNNGILFHDDDCQYSRLSINEPENHPAPQLRMVLLLACETGKNTSAPDNLMARFRLIGARKVIGFNNKMLGLSLNSWNDSFWTYAVKDRMEVGDAARKASLEAKVLGLQAISPSELVILGTEDVFLVPDEETIPEIDIPDPKNWFDPEKWIEDFEKIAADFLRGLQYRLIAILEHEFQKFVQALFDYLLSYINQCCAAPFGLVLFAAVPVFRRVKRNRNKTGDRL